MGDAARRVVVFSACTTINVYISQSYSLLPPRDQGRGVIFPAPAILLSNLSLKHGRLVSGIKYRKSPKLKCPGTFGQGPKHFPFQCPEISMPKVFKLFSSKNAPRAGRDAANPAANDSAIHERDTSSKSLSVPTVVPTDPANLSQAWTAVHKELPQAQGAEKVLNLAGASIIRGSMSLQDTGAKMIGQQMCRTAWPFRLALMWSTRWHCQRRPWRTRPRSPISFRRE